LAVKRLEKQDAVPPNLPKAATGIDGLDDITGGGFPRGRPTLICGAAGSGKTLLAMEFLVRGITQFNESGVFMAFEERAEELTQNVRSLGFDLEALVAEKKLALDHVYIERSEIEETGLYDLEGLFVRLGFAIDEVGAKRVVLDTIEALFSGLSDEAILRAELRRLFRWLKDKGVTAVITGERGVETLTRQGLEEYVSDCVILLDHRVNDQLATRRLRIVKYRGTVHGTNEYPFLIDEKGISVLPITSFGLAHDVSTERITTGIPQLDGMLGGEGFFRGSSVLVSGTAGTGKTSIAAHLAHATSRRGERCLYFAFEESPGQLQRNMRSIGVDLALAIKKGLLRILAWRPTQRGLELHLVTIQKEIAAFKPQVVVFDPISSFTSAGTVFEAQAMLMRLVDYLKSQGITVLFVNLTSGTAVMEASEVGISSLMDTWLLVRNIELGGERNRGLYVLKARGMGHSNQIREFLISSQGIELREVSIGSEGVLTGSMRLAQEVKERAEAASRNQQIERRKRELERKRVAMEAQMEALRSEFETEEAELRQIIAEARQDAERRAHNRAEMAKSRTAEQQRGAGPRRGN
jgi:circadian clock protein KaiC